MDLRASFAVNGRSGGLIQFHTDSSLLVGGWKVKTFVGMIVCAVLFVSLGANAFAAHSNYGCSGCHVAHNAVMENESDGIWGVPLWSAREFGDTGEINIPLDQVGPIHH